MTVARKMRILLIENDFEQAHAVSHSLRREFIGCRVSLCRSRQEVERRLEESDAVPDAVICSHPVGGTAVRDLLEGIRIREIHPPTIVLFDESFRGSIRETLPDHVRDYLFKDREGNYVRLLPVLLEKVLGLDAGGDQVAIDDDTGEAEGDAESADWFVDDAWTDLPQRRQVESELRRVRAWLTALVENQPAAILVELEDGRIGLANRKMCEMFQLCDSPYELVGGDWREVVRSILEMLEDSNRFAGCIEGLSHGRGSILGREWVLLDGRTVEMDCTPIFRGDELRGRFWIFRDVTRRRKEERALRWAARMEATATLAGGIAHDFNNLMQAVLGNAELLQTLFPGDGEMAPMLQQIARSARRGGELSQQMLAYARGGRYRPRRCSLNDSARRIARLQDAAEPGRVRLELDLSDDPGEVAADADQMDMAITSLVANAAEAIEGTGWIRIRTGNRRIGRNGVRELPNMKPGDYSVLSVQDSGAGMDPETVRRVFEPFFSTKFQGRGLGLAAVYGIVKNHGGYITAESKPGRGSTFRIYLPLLPSGEEIKREPGDLHMQAPASPFTGDRAD